MQYKINSVKYKYYLHVIVFIGILLLNCGQVLAFETRVVPSPDGKPLFELRFFDLGETYDNNASASSFPPEFAYTGSSSWQLTTPQKDAVADAAKLWAEILGPGSRSSRNLPINVGTYNFNNADAKSSPNKDNRYGLTGLAEGIHMGTEPDVPAQIRIGILPFYRSEHLFPLPQQSGFDLTATLFHELGHALGIASLNGKCEWDNHLQDAYGKKYRDLSPVVAIEENGKVYDYIVQDGALKKIEIPEKDYENFFIVGREARSGVTFHGEHVSSVMGEGVGIPINGFEGSTEMPPQLDLSHIELEHCLMSHQRYRNYVVPMEAELALLQDLGYELDRRNFYGFSIYGDNLTMDNRNGYFARNPEGTAYLPGQPNTATLGVGLHIYGKHNTVTQHADLLAGGVAGTGIRIDGSDNTLIVPQDTRVAADGPWGTGLLVAYGKNHVITSMGEVTALGQEGTAVRFDFGNNILASDFEYRGSLMWTYESEKKELHSNTDLKGLPLNLDGPLIKEFNVHGRLAGTAAAIYMSENAFVESINLYSGADITGNIISRWNPDNPLILDTTLDRLHIGRDNLRTLLNFDPDDSSISVRGAIEGANNINIRIASGQVDMHGPVNVHSLQNNGHLALLAFNEQGDGAKVSDSFVLGQGATLETAVMASGQVAGVQTQSVGISANARWRLTPLAGFYPSARDIMLESPIETSAGPLPMEFREISLGRNLSPTLSFALFGRTSTDARIRTIRPPNAYSQYAAGDGDASLGRALINVAAHVSGQQDDMSALFAALDFSASDGSTVRNGLTQLGAEAYDVAARTSLRQQQNFNSLLLRRMLTGESLRRLASRQHNPDMTRKQTGLSSGDAVLGGEPRQPWQAWLTPFASTTTQTSHGSTAGSNSTGVGLLGGMECRLTGMDGEDTGLTLGWHLALAGTRTDINGRHDARANTFGMYLGGQALFSPEDWHGFHIFGQARLGMEDSHMQRSIDINGYHRQNESQWTGLLASGLLGGGYDVTWGDIVAGPLLWLEYSVLRRPGIEENGGGASRLKLEDEIFQSLPMALGGHMGVLFEMTDNLNLQADILAAWRHELLHGEFRSSSAFCGYENSGFTSQTRLVGRDSLLVQGSLRLAHANSLFAQLEVGGEFRTVSTSMNLGLSFGWEF